MFDLYVQYTFVGVDGTPKIATETVAKSVRKDTALQKTKLIVAEGLHITHTSGAVTVIPPHRIWEVKISPVPKDRLL
jgi:hypothetical protein